MEANEICAANGYRLCSVEELLSQTTSEAGCGFNTQLNWAADPCRECCADPTRFDVSTHHLVAAGNPAHSEWDSRSTTECVESEGLYSSDGSGIAVSCCTKEDPFYVFRPFCKVAMSWKEAWTICEMHDGRLCTEQEMLSGNVPDLGCGFNAAYNWVSDPCYS